MNNRFSIEDLQVFCEVVRTLNFSQAAQRLGVSPAFITKRIQILETQLECKLFHRSTRHVSLTEQGEHVFELGRSILDSVTELHEELGVKRNEPRGVLRVSTSFGFGRRVVGESLAEFSRKYPAIEVRLDVLDHLLDLAQNKIDLDIRIGDVISPHYIAKRLARNYRILCASPAYLAKFGAPKDLNELAQHNCLIIKERDHPVGLWKLTRRNRSYTVKVRGSLVTNNGEIAVAWALAGHGITLRSIWDARSHLQSGELINILPDYTQEANIWAVYPERLSSSAKIKLCVKHMEEYFQRWEERGRLPLEQPFNTSDSVTVTSRRAAVIYSMRGHPGWVQVIRNRSIEKMCRNAPQSLRHDCRERGRSPAIRSGLRRGHHNRPAPDQFKQRARDD